jgi:hypothetical protein
MSLDSLTGEQLGAAANDALEEAASRLQNLLAELASRLRPFPAFLNMASVQAVELDPPLRALVDRGCVVVRSDGEICELNLQVVPGAEGLTEIDQLEEFRELPLSVEEYVVYAATAIRVLKEELRRRGR